jgi:hypothetical protein
MFYSIEEVEKDIFKTEGVAVTLPLLDGKFFNFYSDTTDRSPGSSTVDDLLAKINTYVCDNFVPDWIVADNPPPDKFVVYHCQLNSYSTPGERVGEYIPNEDGVISKEEVDKIFSVDYGMIILVHIAAEFCMYRVRRLN